MTARSVFVPGTPKPEGSAKGFVVKGRAVVTHDNAKLNPWRADVHTAVRAVIGDEIVYPTGPVALVMEFRMPRRKAEPKRVTPAHTRKPDSSKLIRAAEDAAIGLIYADDSQVTHIVASKRTAKVGEQPGMFLLWARPDDPTWVPQRWALGVA